jgi:HK97 family phage prohead protease
LRDAEYVRTFTPTIDIVKSSKTKDKEWHVLGYASTDDVDVDGEQIEPSGIDYSYFENNGWITYEHLHGASNIIGEPIAGKIRPDKHGLHIEGVLYKDNPKAQDVWNLNNSLQKDSLSKRSLGFSVEGKVKERDSYNPRIIKSMLLTAVTITTHPANLKATWQGVEKSADIGYTIAPAEMQGVSALRTEAIGSTADSVANALTSLSFVLKRNNTEDILKQAESIMRAKGYLNKNSLVLLLQLSKGISSQEALSYVDRYMKGV